MNYIIYRLISSRDKWLKKTIYVILLLSLSIAGIGGVLTSLYRKYYFNPIKEKDIEYLEQTSRNADDLFLKLSLAKGAVAVIEGSSINIDAIIGGELEVGDIVQPIYDGIDIIWKITLLSAVSLKIQSIIINNTDLALMNLSLGLAIFLFIPRVLLKNRFTAIITRISKSLFILTIVIYFLTPFSVYLNSMGTKYINAKYRDEAVNELEKEIGKLENIKETLFQLENSTTVKKKSFFSTGIKEKFEAVKIKISEINEKLKNSSKRIINILPIIITVYIINTLLLPLTIIFVLYKVIIFVLLHETFDYKEYGKLYKKIEK